MRSCFTRLCFKNLCLHLSLCLCVIARSVVNIQHSIGMFGCFPGMTASLAKSKQIIGAHFQTLFFYNFLIFDVPQYSNRFDYIKDIRPAIYFNSQKIIAYHL